MRVVIIPRMRNRSWQLRNKCWEIPKTGGIVGILNTTPDSFSDGGAHDSLPAALKHAETLLAAGAHIIDIGGESTRPGATPIDTGTEISRTIPLIKALRARHPHALLSIDTRHADVAEAALEAGVDIINDISALTDPRMAALCAECPCGIILMHRLPFDADLPAPERMPQILREFFTERIHTLQQLGISPERLCLDPGIGFGKKAAHTLEILRHQEEFRIADRPILMALSRKRFIGELLNNRAEPVPEALPTVVLSLLAADRGADMHRVHDVTELQTALHLRAALFCV